MTRVAINARYVHKFMQKLQRLRVEISPISSPEPEAVCHFFCYVTPRPARNSVSFASFSGFPIIACSAFELRPAGTCLENASGLAQPNPAYYARGTGTYAHGHASVSLDAQARGHVTRGWWTEAGRFDGNRRATLADLHSGIEAARGTCLETETMRN